MIQSCYVPWRGYFDFIRSVDLFVLYDDVQYSSGSWRNRNRLKMRDGLHWMTVPVRARFGQCIDEVEVGSTTGHAWQQRHRQQIEEALHSASYFADASRLWQAAVASNYRRLSDLNLDLIRQIAAYLGIDTRIVRSSDFRPLGAATERLIDLLTKVGARTYVSGPAAKGYLEESRFRDAGIRLEYKTYDYRPYPQLWGPFEGAVTVLDLIANCGPKARDYINSSTPNEVAIP